MIVCIAEKPSVAKDIARILGANHPQNGFYEGNGYQVTWTFGHLCELKAPGDYTEAWKRWSITALPMIPPRFGIKLKEDEGIKKQFEVIKRIMSQAQQIINCGDAGQEGELIQRWVMQKAGVKCPVMRLWISSMTDEAIKEGFQKLKPQQDYQNLYMAGLSRAVGDWLLGMNCTRLYTLKYGNRSQILSIGRVQTPTLALVVKRQKEIDNFKPEPYWVLSTIYRQVVFQATKGKFMVKEEAMAALDNVKEKPFEILSVNAKEGNEAPPKLYDLTSLQVDCNKKFGYSADLTLTLIQGLYEKKYTTYPRVDTTFLSDDIYPKCPATLQGLRGYEQLTAPLLGTKLLKRKKVFDSSKVTDHHAIIPTGQPAVYLSDMERNVYDLIARAFIAVFYPDCKFKQTTVIGKTGDVEFKATGKVILFPGWRVVYPKSGNNAQDAPDNPGQDVKEQTLPDFSQGESGPHEPQLMEKQTQPPAYYTEATLLRAMETAGKTVDNDELREALKENGIGRPSTRAAIIETLFKRRYIKRERKKIVATITGIQLIDVINEELLKSAELTGLWEKKLREIEKGKYDVSVFIDELKSMVSQIVYNVTTDNTRKVVTATQADVDKKTEKTKVEKKLQNSDASQSNNSVAGFQPRTKKTTTKRKKTTKKTTDAGDDLAAESTSNQSNTGQQNVQDGQLKANSADVSAAQDEWVGLPCPVCKVGHIIKGRTAYGCSRWKEGCGFRRLF